MVSPVVSAALLFVLYAAWRWANSTDKPKIEGIPEIPGYPIFGSLYELGTLHCKVAQKWAQKYGPVFQVKLGHKRIMFVNSFDSVKHFWVTNQSALISRPTLHTFHTLVSGSEAFTIGTSPWDESCKRKRKAAANALNVVSVRGYMPIVDLEATTSIREMLKDSNYGAIDINPIGYFQRYALNTSLTLNWGFRIEGNINAFLLKEICDVERGIATFRSTSNNWEDYVPLLRMIPGKRVGPGEMKTRRAKYMDELLGKLKEQISNGTDKPCITGNILKDPEAKLNDKEIDSIGLTMVSAGLDTIPGNLIMGLGYLSTPHGQEIQQKAYAAIQEVYPDGDAWHKCLDEEKIPYITALYKEVLRYWTVIPMCLPRVSIKDIEYKGAIVPAGTTFYMNAYAADYDEEHFKDPSTFNVERMMDGSDEKTGGVSHYSYGAGSRMCAGSHLANRELFVAFTRLISAFEILPPKDPKDRPETDCLKANALPTSLTLDPKPFKVGFRVRDRERLEKWIEESDVATAHL